MREARKIAVRKGIMGGAPCLAGTRIPTEAIWTLFKRGFGREAIAKLWPKLITVDDVDAALRFEMSR